MREGNSRLVYSTNREVPVKEKPADRFSRVPSGPVRSGARIRLDRKGRGGKSVTVIEGLQLSSNDSEKLLKQLKTKLGTGGTVKNGALEIQGDHCDVIMAELAKMGYQPKHSGR